jgi:hypothetical protein
MKTITLTAEEIRMLGIQMEANACSKGCPLDHMPRLPKLNSVTYDCYAHNSKGEYICPFQRAMDSISDKLWKKGE